MTLPVYGTVDDAISQVAHFTEGRTLTQNAAPLTPEQEQRVRAGQELYAMACVACHQPHGGGVPGIAPPLVGSEWVSGPPERLARIVMNGLYGPIQVNGQTWNLSMPAHGTYTDEDVAAVLSYIRRAWGNTADPVTAEAVKAVRAKHPDREDLWTEAELLKLE